MMRLEYTHPFGVIMLNVDVYGVEEADTLVIREALGRIRMKLNTYGLDFNEDKLKVIRNVETQKRAGRPRKAV